MLGVAAVFVQRGCRVVSWALEERVGRSPRSVRPSLLQDSVAKLPERFSRKVHFWMHRVHACRKK